MSSRTRTGSTTNQPPVDLDSPPKLRRSNRGNRQSSSRRTNNVVPTKSRIRERDATPRVRNIKADDVSSSDHYDDSHHSRRGRREPKYVSDEDEGEDSAVEDACAEETQSEASSGTYSSGHGSSAASSNVSGDDDEISAEDAYAKSIATAHRRMRQDDYGVIKPGVGAGWPKKSLLEASSSRIDGASFSGARVGATADPGGTLHAGSLKQARANAVARRNRTTEKLQRQKEQQHQQKQKERQHTTTPNTSKKESAESPDTAATISTTMSSSSPLSTADLSPPPPSAARAYNRFFPPKLVESNDVLGADKVLSLDPNAETGEIEVYTEEKYYTTTSSTNPRSEASYESYGASQWALIAELAKKECGPGAGQQQQYHDDKDETFSLASLPTVLNNGDVFHESASKAVASLLSLPRYKRHRDRGGGAYDATENSKRRNGGGDDDASSVAASAFSGFSAYSTYSTYSATNNNRVLGEVSEHKAEEGVPDGADGAPLVSEKTEEFVNSIPNRMLQPNKQIYDLVAVIHIGEDDASTQPLTTAATRGMMTRRMNACGAVKLLTAKSATACVRLAWTAGVLSSLTSVLFDSPFNYVDKATYDAYNVARKRTIAALIAMSDAKENRILMLHSPGLVHSLIKTIDEADNGQCKLGCSMILTHLSKEVENRLLLAKTPGLVETLLETILQKENDIDNLYESSPNKDLYATKANAFAIFLNLAKEERNAVSFITIWRCYGVTSFAFVVSCVFSTIIDFLP